MTQVDSSTPSVPEGTPQAPTKRHFWSKPKVQHKPTLKNKRDFAKAVKQGVYPS
jgi:hypothetical protein